MQIVSFMNMKGGVGKTTVAVNVAYGLASLHNKKVLIVDGDPQFNATQSLISDNAYLIHLNDPKKGTIKDIFLARRPGIVSTTAGTAKPINKSRMSLAECSIEIYHNHRGGRLDLIPSTLTLIEVEHSPRQTETRLKSFLHECQ